MNIKDISTQLLYTTVPIWGITKNGSNVSGTGFIFNYKTEDDKITVPLLITNYHVLEHVEKGIIEFSLRENDLPAKGKGIRIDFDNSTVNNYKLDDLDIVAIPIAGVLRNLEHSGKQVFYVTISQDIIPNKIQIDELAAIEDITFIGYPSGIYDNYNVSSIIRRGITATPIWNDFKGERAFLIDAGVFPGSSGSPVFILNQGSYPTINGITIGSRVLFVGILTETIIRNDKTFLGLGKVINSFVFYEKLKIHVEELLEKDTKQRASESKS